jgi:hypothetical protein
VFYDCAGIEQFFTANSTELFDAMKIPRTFFVKEPAEWEEDDG